MYRLFGPTCVICQARFISHSNNAQIISFLPQNLLSGSTWPSQARYLSRYRTQRPSRMELSQNVAKSRLRNGKDNKEKKKRGRSHIAGPFAAMNRTKVTIPEAEFVKTRPSTSRSTNTKSNERDSKRGGSREEYKALKMQQVLAHVGYGKRSRIKQQISSVTSFQGFPFLPLVKENAVPCTLPDLGDAVPTPIQRLAIPTLLGSAGRRRSKKDDEFRQFLLAAETGSGKTLAYMAPVIDAIKRIEFAENEEQPLSSKSNLPVIPENPDLFALEDLAAAESKYPQGRPRGIVLVPTAELVDQVGKLAKSFSHKVKFRACLISSAFSPTIIRNRLSSPGGIDLLITTPQLLSSIAKSNPAILSRVSHLVIDEADSLLDRSFEPFTTTIVERARPTLRQLIMCSATIPKKMDNYLRKHYPDVVRLTTPNLHAIPRRVQLTVVDVAKNNYFNNKDLACADTIWKIGQSPNEPSDESEATDNKGVKKVMVFVNEREKTTELAEYLRTKGIDAVALSRDTDARQERNLLSEFQGGEPTVDENKISMLSEISMKTGRKLANTRVVVVTDLASRGIDTTSVRDVILYDVPHTSIDFIHRLGRTGRMGRRGRGFVLVGRDDRKDVVSEVRHGMYRGQALI